MRVLSLITLATAASAAPLQAGAPPVARAPQILEGTSDSLAGLKLDKSLGGQLATLLGAKDGGALGTGLGPLLVGLLGAGVVEGRDAEKSPLAARSPQEDSLAGLKLDKSLGGQLATLLGAKDGGALGTGLGPLLVGLLGAGVVETPDIAKRAPQEDSLAGLKLDKSLGGQLATLLGAKDGGALGTGLGPLLVGLLGAGLVETPDIAARAPQDNLAGLQLNKSLGGQLATLLGAKDGGALGTGLGPLLVGLLGAGAVEGRDIAARAPQDNLAGLQLDKSLGGQLATLLGAKDGGALGTGLGPLLVGLLGTSTAPPV